MSDKERIEKALNLLEELIGVAEQKDEEHVKEALRSGKSEQAVGESYDVFYLRLLRKVLKGEE